MYVMEHSIKNFEKNEMWHSQLQIQMDKLPQKCIFLNNLIVTWKTVK